MLLAVILHPAHVRDRDGAGKLPRQARGSLVQPDGDDGDEGDGGEGGGGASVVARCDAAPILEPAGHGLDAMVLAMERGIGGEGRLAFLVGGMRAAIPRSADAARKGLPCPLGTFGPAAALGDRLARRRQHRRKKARPLRSFICPAESIMTPGRPWPSQTAWSVESGPPLVRRRMRRIRAGVSRNGTDTRALPARSGSRPPASPQSRPMGPEPGARQVTVSSSSSESPPGTITSGVRSWRL